MYRANLFVAALGLVLSSHAFAEADCVAKVESVKNNISAADYISDEQKVYLLQRVARAEELCKSGKHEQATRELATIITDEVEAFVEAPKAKGEP